MRVEIDYRGVSENFSRVEALEEKGQLFSTMSIKKVPWRRVQCPNFV